MVFGLKTKSIVVIVACLSLIAAGWQSRAWYDDSKSLAVIKAQNALAEKIREGQAQISREIEERLSQLRANERIIDRGIIREIQRPVYQRVCFEPELVSLLNAAARGEAPGKSDGESSDGTAND